MKRLVWIWSVVLTASIAALAPTAPALTSSAGADGVRYKDEVFSSVDVTSDVFYKQPLDYAGNPVDLTLDVYEPTGDTETERPLFIWIHGGSFAYGDKADPMDVDIATRLAKRGFVVASINYRLRPLPVCACNFLDNPEALSAIGQAYMDGTSAVTFLRAHAADYGIDTDRIIIGGASAGAVTALNVAYFPQRWKGQGAVGDPVHVDGVVSIAGMTLPGYIEAGEAPLFMAHGTIDTTVPYQGGVDTCNAAIAKGIHCTLASYPTDHFQLVDYLDDIVTRGTDDLYSTVISPPPSVTSLTPNTGTGAGGTVVTINGSHLEGTTSVKFGNTPATSFTVVSPTQVTAVAPPSATGLFNVYVTTPDGTGATSYRTWFAYTTPGPPVVTTLNPRSSPAPGGTTITISGRGFTAATAVTFGSVPAASYTVVSDSKITAVTPASASGIVNVWVSTPVGQSTSGLPSWHRFV